MHISTHFPSSARVWLVFGLLAIFTLAGCTAIATTEIKAQVPTAVATQPAQATTNDDEHAQKFALWVNEFSAFARKVGISEATLHIAFDPVHFLPGIIELDRAQPEFTRPVWDYLDNALSAQRITRGQYKLQQLGSQAVAITARYGVPMEIVVAIWGMESNYGSNFGDIPTIDALATLGFEGRREVWARSQLLAALKILQSGDIDRTRMIGSWAGAMGQTQFLPSNFLAYAVDADGDGRRDLWGSAADVVASTANFLASSGWQAGQSWGTEVRLPPEFDYARADDDVRQTSTAWAEEGVQSMNGTPLPALIDSSIWLASTAGGPAFLIGTNFRTILRYNNSTSYALAVSLLAQRLAGGPPVQALWPRDVQALTRSQLLAMQTILNTRGFDSGTPDGMMGPATRRGIRRYQRSLGLPADGYPSLNLLQQLQQSSGTVP
ncbi:MAG: lytic murein transglycosylase [Rhodoferax sp.]|uniref:lytic murein transglycosylase n=1 Tax=Rhodoferax sp. TaxID=50421 RepID=UPI002637A911|nr:lytic murein transglycosylase [Rhodoferax sp.]MDD2882518.1 lytic murein transglycosylase [Rhodoferax sp.]